MNTFITTKNNTPQAEKIQKMNAFYQEFEASKKFMEQFVVDCVISVMKG